MAGANAGLHGRANGEIDLVRLPALHHTAVWQSHSIQVSNAQKLAGKDTAVACPVFCVFQFHIIGPHHHLYRRSGGQMVRQGHKSQRGVNPG